jgi:hypothetical protein
MRAGVTVSRRRQWADCQDACGKPACFRQPAPEPLLLQCGGPGHARRATHARAAADAGENRADHGAPVGDGGARYVARVRQTGVRPAPPASSAEARRLRSCARGCAISGARAAQTTPVRRSGCRQPGRANCVRVERSGTCGKLACVRQLAPEPLLLCGGLARAGRTQHAGVAADAGEARHAAKQGPPAGSQPGRGGARCAVHFARPAMGAPCGRPRAANRRASGAAGRWRRTAIAPVAEIRSTRDRVRAALPHESARPSQKG